MTEDPTPESIEVELVDAAMAFTLALRSRQGLDSNLYDLLVEALRRSAVQWSDAECIPRLVTNVLVDLQPAMLATAELYEETVKAQVIDAAISIGDLIRDVVAVTEGEWRA